VIIISWPSIKIWYTSFITSCMNVTATYSDERMAAVHSVNAASHVTDFHASPTSSAVPNNFGTSSGLLPKTTHERRTIAG
jgi:hypothetical protein